MTRNIFPTILIGTALAFTSCQTTEKKETAPQKQAVIKKATPVKTKAPESALSIIAPIKETWEVRGYISPDHYQEIRLVHKNWKSFKLLEFLEEGSLVKKGDTVARFDDTDIRLYITGLEEELVASQASLDQARINFNEDQKRMQMSLAAAELSSKRANENLQNFIDWGKDDEILAEKMKLDDYRTRMHYVSEELKQLTKMYTEDDLTQESEEFILEKKRKQLRDMEIYLKMSERDLKVTLGSTIPDKQKALERTKAEQEIALTKKKEEWRVWEIKQRNFISKLEREHNKRIKTLNDTKEDLKLFTVTADLDGVLYYGESIHGNWRGENNVRELKAQNKPFAPMWTMATIVDETQLSATALFNEAQILKLKDGMAVEMVTDTNKKIIFHGKVSEHSAIRVKPHFYRLKASFANEKTHTYIKPGMGVKIRVVNYSKDKAVQIPQPFLKREGKRTYVLVKNGDKIIKQDVKAGSKQGVMIEITEGLAHSTRVYKTH